MKKTNILLLVSFLIFCLSVWIYFLKNRNEDLTLVKTNSSQILKSNAIKTKPLQRMQLRHFSKYSHYLDEYSQSDDKYDANYHREAYRLFVGKMTERISARIGQKGATELIDNYFALLLESYGSGDGYYKDFQESEKEYYEKIKPSNIPEAEKKEFKKQMMRKWKKQYHHREMLKRKKYSFWGDFSDIYMNVKEEVNAEMSQRQPNSDILFIEL